MNGTENSTVEFLSKHVGKLRLVVFREDDCSNRRLLFDSNNINATDGKIDRSSVRRQADADMLAELIFGSTMVCGGESIKLHRFKEPEKIMFTKIFSAYHLTGAASALSNLTKEQNSLLRRFSVDFEKVGRRQNVTGNVDISPLKYSQPDLSTRVVKETRRSSESSEDFEVMPPPRRPRRERIGVAVIINVGSEENECAQRRIHFLCSQSQNIFAAMKDELQDVLIAVRAVRANTTEVIFQAWHQFLLSMKVLCEAVCRAHYALKFFTLSWSLTSTGDSAVQTFIDTLLLLEAKYDNKQTNFFLSTLISALLGMIRSTHLDPQNRRIFTEIRLHCKDATLLKQWLDVIGYFLKYVVVDFDCISLKPLSSVQGARFTYTAPSTGAFAAFWSNLRNKRNASIPTTHPHQVGHSKSFHGEMSSTNGFLSSPTSAHHSSPTFSHRSTGRRSSPMNFRYGAEFFATSPSSFGTTSGLSPIITGTLEENGVKEEEEEENLEEEDENGNEQVTHAIASSSNSNADENGDAAEEEFLLNFFNEVQERPLRPTCLEFMDDGAREKERKFTFLCGENLANLHRFSEEMNGFRDVVVSLGNEKATVGSPQVLIVDAVACKVYHAYVDDLNDSTPLDWTACFPSALVTETLENLRTLRSSGFDASCCLMHLEDVIRSLYAKANALASIVRDNDKSELSTEFCAKLLRCDIADLSFIM